MSATDRSTKGYFITLEGPDGSGKSTQVDLLAEALRAAGYPVTVSREPGGTPLGERVRALLLDGNQGPILAWTEALLFTAARAELVAQVIRPRLAQGAIVVCDRYRDSTLAYQGAGRGLDAQLLARLQEQATAGLRPDLTLWFDVAPLTARQRRRAGARNRLDRETPAFHARVQDGYRALAARDPKRWVPIDARLDPVALQAAVLKIVVGRLQAAGLRPRAPRSRPV